MKVFLTKISSIFFLTILLASNIVNLHIYSHDQIQDFGCHQIDDLDHNESENDKDTPCDICIIAINLHNLDYNTSLELSFENSNKIQHLPQKNTVDYVEKFQKQPYLSKNRNKAPPSLA